VAVPTLIICVVPSALTYPRIVSRTGFATDSGYERTFSKLPKVIQVQWKLPKQKDFYVLIYGYFNQNRPSLLSNVGHKCWAQMPTAADDTMEVPT
jgi:hypothetical protein